MDTKVNLNQQLAQLAVITEEASSLTLEEIEQQKKKNTIIDYKMVTFSLAGKDYAIDIMKVKEIAKAGRFTYVPNTLPFVLGVYNLRGEIIPIVDLRLFFNIEIEERKDDAIENMLIVNVGEQTFGVVVDEIDKVVGIQKSSIQPPHPLFGDINIKYIYGVVEAERHLYILLDIERIFGAKTEEDIREIEESRLQGMAESKEIEGEEHKNSISAPVNPSAEKEIEKISVKKEEKEAVETLAEKKDEDLDYTFIVSSLKNFKKFSVSSLNSAWTKKRFLEWTKERGIENAQLQNENDAEKFLSTFPSECSSSWWTEDYANAVFASLPENSAKNIVVWNIGCGKGFESYSLACILKKKYPSSGIHIYAHDIDLLSVSNAPLMNVSDDAAADWYMPYVTKTVSGDWTFKKEIKDSIMFEYHDCMNTNTLPPIDIVFARDILSYLPDDAKDKLIADFKDEVKGNGLVFIGENEDLSEAGWKRVGKGNISVFSK